MKVGMIGGGQLGRMLALAGYPLGLTFRFLEPNPAAPMTPLAEQVVGPYDDPDALERFVAGLDVITYEFENVPVHAAEWLAQRCPVFPPPAALAAAQDRLHEKQCFQQQGIPTAPFAPVGSLDELTAALATIGTPAVLKTRRLGYDGKGQVIIQQAADAPAAWDSLGGGALILEGFIGFVRELSVLAVRSRTGETCFYPLVQNEHQQGILARSLAPAPDVAPTLRATAEDYATRLLDALGYVGVLALELFQTGPDTLLANEMAPRVHNSGHWTIEGAMTSQFANHLRAVAGLPLGATAARGHTTMTNLLGTLPDPAALLADPHAHLHLYGKAPRPGRKLGHVTVLEQPPGEPSPAPENQA